MKHILQTERYQSAAHQNIKTENGKREYTTVSEKTLDIKFSLL